MQKRDPEGYRKLLAYQKAQDLHSSTIQITRLFPKTKTFFDLADQMDRSGRSGNKNIVEGWKRNTTKEYFDFLGFSIGAVEELKDDAADVATGIYPALMGIKGVVGERGNPLHPLTPLFPLPTTREDLDKLKFYPLDPGLPPIVQLFLKAKEVNYLLYKLQQSLDVKMDKELTKPLSEKVRNRFLTDEQADKDFNKYLESIGLKKLENGRFINVNQEVKGDNGN